MSGGVAALLADTATDAGVELPTLTDETVERIRAANPVLSAPQNPLDAWGTGWDPETFPAVIGALLDQTDIGSIGLVLDIPSSGRAETHTAVGAVPILAAASGRALTKLIMINSNTQGTTHPQVSAALREAGLPCLMGTTQAIRAISHWSRWPRPQPLDVARRPVPDLTAAGAAFGAQIDALTAAGVPFVASRVAKTALHARELAEQLGFPVALKAVHPQAPHKSDAGLVLLGLSGCEQVQRGFDELVAQLARLNLDPRHAEIVVQGMEPVRLELIVGVRRWPGFGELVVVGFGGVYVEIFKRASVRLAPIDEEVVRGMFRELELDTILAGARGAGAYDAMALIDLIIATADVAAAAGADFEVLELNPVVVRPFGSGAAALDVHVETTALARRV
jgi:acyl-CoA synthetase (NDP forming)